MLVRMLVGIGGPFYTLDPGDEFHFPDDEASRLISANFAVAVEAAPIATVIETATVNTANLERRGGRPRKHKDVVSDDGNDAS